MIVEIRFIRIYFAVLYSQNIIEIMTSKFIARLSQALRKNKTVTESSPDSSAKTLKATFGIGTLIDQRYRLVAEIGRGGMGIVYRAHDIQKDLDVALKIILG